jgi:hypothetical protein
VVLLQGKNNNDENITYLISLDLVCYKKYLFSWNRFLEFPCDPCSNKVKWPFIGATNDLYYM